MNNVQEIITLLQSEDSDERYNACLQLMKLSPIPPEAFEALQLATKDEDPVVSNAAQKVIMLHTAVTSTSNNEDGKVETNSDKAKNIHKTFSILYIGVIALCAPVVLIGQVFDANELANSFIIDSLWVIISIVTSRFLINKEKFSIAYLILFSAPIVVFVYETILWNIRQASF